MKATLNGETIAESDTTVLLEGNHYFPRSSVKTALLHTSPRQYTCPWKGKATYYSTEKVADVAWSYDDPKPAARKIQGHIAFDTSKVKVA